MDNDFHSDLIHVKRNVTHPQKNRPSITTPKTKAGIRTIPLIEPLRKALSPFEESGFIIGGDEPITMTMYNTMWKHIQESVDTHGATPHTLRHSYLTYAVGATTDFNPLLYKFITDCVERKFPKPPRDYHLLHH